MGTMRNANIVLIGKPEKKGPLRMPLGRWGIILELS
jgi:hypothetical protein